MGGIQRKTSFNISKNVNSINQVAILGNRTTKKNYKRRSGGKKARGCFGLNGDVKKGRKTGTNHEGKKNGKNEQERKRGTRQFRVRSLKKQTT